MTSLLNYGPLFGKREGANLVNLTTNMLFLFFCICLSKILHLKKHIFVFVILNNEDISNNVAMKTTIQTTLQHPKNIDSKYHEEKNAMNITLELDLKKIK